MSNITNSSYRKKLNAEYRLIDAGEYHGEPGHFNYCVRDHDSCVTGFGVHDRVAAFLPDHEGLYLRVDHKWKLGEPTIEQILRVARVDQEVRGRWYFDRKETADDGSSTDYYFLKGRSARSAS